MSDRPTTLERAYQIARSGTCEGVSAIADQLRREGYADGERHLAGRLLRRQLSRLCAEARAADRGSG